MLSAITNSPPLLYYYCIIATITFDLVFVQIKINSAQTQTKTTYLINNNVFTDFVFQYFGLIQKCMRVPSDNQVNILGLLCQKHIAYLRSIIIVIAQMRKTNNQITMVFFFENPHHILCNFYW